MAKRFLFAISHDFSWVQNEYQIRNEKHTHYFESRQISRLSYVVCCTPACSMRDATSVSFRGKSADDETDNAVRHIRSSVCRMRYANRHRPSVNDSFQLGHLTRQMHRERGAPDVKMNSPPSWEMMIERAFHGRRSQLGFNVSCTTGFLRAITVYDCCRSRRDLHLRNPLFRSTNVKTQPRLMTGRM